MTNFELGLHRSSRPIWYDYTGDGNGRDGYIIFNNGGLNELRRYEGSKPNGWKHSQHARAHVAQPRKEATSFDYVPDGSGRDSYIIQNYGLKRNYRSQYKPFEKGLRSEIVTPMMDAKIQRKRGSYWGTDATHFVNWPSPQAVRANQKQFSEQRKAVERLSNSPPRERMYGRSSSKEGLQGGVPSKTQMNWLQGANLRTEYKNTLINKATNKDELNKVIDTILQPKGPSRRVPGRNFHSVTATRAPTNDGIARPRILAETQTNFYQDAEKERLNEVINRRGISVTEMDLRPSDDVMYKTFDNQAKTARHTAEQVYGITTGGSVTVKAQYAGQRKPSAGLVQRASSNFSHQNNLLTQNGMFHRSAYNAGNAKTFLRNVLNKDTQKKLHPDDLDKIRRISPLGVRQQLSGGYKNRKVSLPRKLVPGGTMQSSVEKLDTIAAQSQRGNVEQKSQALPVEVKIDQSNEQCVHAAVQSITPIKAMRRQSMKTEMSNGFPKASAHYSTLATSKGEGVSLQGGTTGKYDLMATQNSIDEVTPRNDFYMAAKQARGSRATEIKNKKPETFSQTMNDPYMNIMDSQSFAGLNIQEQQSPYMNVKGRKLANNTKLFKGNTMILSKQKSNENNLMFKQKSSSVSTNFNKQFQRTVEPKNGNGPAQQAEPDLSRASGE